jgi:adenylate kinase
MMNLVILGSPGSGKGTQALMLARRYSLLRISTGDILRDAVLNGTELGNKAKGYMESGGLVPDELVVELIEETLNNSEMEEGFILDGFPRTLNQAKALHKLLVGMGEVIDYVIYLDVSKDEVVKRLSLRRSCPNCNRLYNMVSDPPSDGNNCDECNSELIIRRDDKEEVVLNRLEIYNKETLPILKWYDQKSKVVKINGELNSSEVLEQILRFLDQGS